MEKENLKYGLRGRSISYEVFPLSFPEFLRFRGLEHEPYSRRSESRVAAALEDYLDTGGLPEIVLADPPSGQAAGRHQRGILRCPAANPGSRNRRAFCQA